MTFEAVKDMHEAATALYEMESRVAALETVLPQKTDPLDRQFVEDRLAERRASLEDARAEFDRAVEVERMTRG